MKTITIIVILFFCTGHAWLAPAAEAQPAGRVVLASWYDAAGMTCATWDYPLGTRLKVTEAHNRSVVIVTVTDRGPAHRLVRQGRRIDLSAVAFARLDGLELGIAEVQVEVVR